MVKTYKNSMEEAYDTKQLTHRLKVIGTDEIVLMSLTHNEWMDKIWSDGATDKWCITLDDGRDCYDMGTVRAKTHDVHGTWPMTSYACGVHADEVSERMLADRQAGVPTEYTPDGDPILRSAGHRNRYLKMRGIHDKNGGYRN